MIYVVKSGDTLAAIAAKQGTTVSAILGANPQIKNANVISVGQKITIPDAAPGGAGTGGSTGGASPKPPEEPAGGGQSAGPQTGPWELPTQGTARKLAATDFETAARDLGCETAAVRAVSEVESGGRTGFDAQKRPKILFETHLFRKNSGGRFNTSHPHLTAKYKTKLQRASYKKDQWTVIREAFALDKEAAVKSASWGMFQVLGMNYKIAGWKSVRQFVADMFVSEAQHMRAFLGFCRSNNLVRHLKSHNWASFALSYNGPDYKTFNYDTKMANAYKRYSKKA